MSWLSLFRRTRTPQIRRSLQTRPRSRPQLEALEERTLLNNRFVVPVGAPVDNTTNFATLAQALTTAGLANGDTIQIEPGSAPGNLVNANFTTAFTGVTNLTIQGDPAVGVSSIPQFTISDATTIAAANTLNLKNANVGLVTAGALTFSGNTSISGSVIVDVNSSSGIPITFAGTTDVLTGSTVVNNIAVSNVVFDVNTPAGGSSNLISGNTFLSNATATGTNAVFAYFGGAGAAVTDKVSGNTFTASPGTTATFAVIVQESVTGLTIQNNTISGAIANGILQFASTPQNLQILGNTVNISGAAPNGIVINGGAAATTTSATISANVLNAGPNGTGLSITVGAGTLNLSVQGNDFHGNKVGVNINAGVNSVTGIDLGGGNQGSLGDNNFRSFTAAATATAAAIIATATTGTIQAQNNIFAVANPQTVIFVTGAATVNATALSANAAYVAVIYNDFLKRPGNTTNAADAGGFVNLLNGGSNSLAVASSLIRSPESLGVIVNGLYLKIFNRTAEAGGTQFFVGLLQKNFTIEQVITVMVTSTEFANQAGSDGGFVQLLYLKLLGRTGNQGETSFWVSLIGTPGVGRAGVAKAILGSAEFRGDVIQAVYGFTSGTPGNLPPTSSVVSILPNMLHRTAAPGAGELAFWQNLPLDIGNEVVIIASSPEFFNNG